MKQIYHITNATIAIALIRTSSSYEAVGVSIATCSGYEGCHPYT